MLTLAVVLAALAAYLWYGFTRVAPAYVTRKVAAQCAFLPTSAKDPAWVARERRDAAGDAIGLALVWPAYLAGRALTGSIADQAPFTDHELRQRLAERDRRIAELHRELNMGGDR